MSREIEVVALAVRAQVLYCNLDEKSADKLVATLIGGWQARNVPFDVDLFNQTALGRAQ